MPSAAVTGISWTCKVHGNVAATSFIDVVELGPAQGREQYRYRSVETWLQEKGGWKMIGSETLTLHDDPPAVVLDQKTLTEYVGTYEASPGIDIVFTRQGDRLLASLNGGSGVAQEAQAPTSCSHPDRARHPRSFSATTAATSPDSFICAAITA